jgi:hypothetical protein
MEDADELIITHEIKNRTPGKNSKRYSLNNLLAAHNLQTKSQN